ncbi:MAG: pyrrolo-quinoline quinone, partial [Myxococcota bacterium]|nr:pyrrolo-quinoline quinone [Myxococcota bacterium]
MKHLLTVALLLVAPLAAAADWPVWGRTANRNMASPERGLPANMGGGKRVAGSDAIDTSGAKEVRWVTKLGSQSYGNVTVADGRIFLGTNNAVPRDPKLKGDYSIVLALDEA